MSRPPINPEKSVAGIAVDPQTLERVIPESRRPDGTVRKQIKIRPGFTPQEDVRRFRGTRQAQMDANALPKGHIVGWAPPPKSTANTAAAAADAKPLSKSAKKNAKRKEKREKEKGEGVPENWDDDDDEGEAKSTEPASSATKASTTAADSKATSRESTSKGPGSKADELSSDALADKLDKLQVK